MIASFLSQMWRIVAMAIGEVGRSERQVPEEVALGMAILLMMFLYVAWFITWGGTVMASCTMADAKSLGGAMVYSCLFYLGGILSLPGHPLGRIGAVVSVPLCIALVWQAIWGAELFVIVNVSGFSACNLMIGEGYGEAQGGWIELLYAPYYVLVSVGSFAAILLSHQRYRKGKNR